MARSLRPRHLQAAHPRRPRLPSRERKRIRLAPGQTRIRPARDHLLPRRHRRLPAPRRGDRREFRDRRPLVLGGRWPWRPPARRPLENRHENVTRKAGKRLTTLRRMRLAGPGGGDRKNGYTLPGLAGHLICVEASQRG